LGVVDASDRRRGTRDDNLAREGRVNDFPQWVSDDDLFLIGGEAAVLIVSNCSVLVSWSSSLMHLPSKSH